MKKISGLLLIAIVAAIILGVTTFLIKKAGSTKKTQLAEAPQKVEAKNSSTGTTTSGSGAKTPKRFKIPKEGLRKWLELSPAIYPKGGCIYIDTPSGREIHDCPGSDHAPEEPAGFYTFRPDKGQEVVIYNRW
ncbi:MAG: hypothetical protein AAB510_00135 [Patescibacteria group bacterium]